MRYLKATLLLILLFLLTGCAGIDGHSKEIRSLSVRQLWAGIQCGPDRPSPHAIWIEDPDQFKKTSTRLNGHNNNLLADLLSRVDFSREGIFIAAMGQKPTGGYGLHLARESAAIKNEAAVLKVTWVEPQKGAMLPQMITSPCLAISLPKGPYSQIDVIDQNMQLRLQLNIE